MIFLFACVVNIRREIKGVNKVSWFTCLFISLCIMSIFHIIGGRATIYYCLRLPLFALSRFGMVLLVVLFCALCSLAVSLYGVRSNNAGLFSKLKNYVWFISYMSLCAFWYPIYFAWQREASALLVLILALIFGIFSVKKFAHKCFVAGALMSVAQMIIIYMFFLQLCINILN